MTLHEATKALTKELSMIYEERETKAIADWVLEYLTGWKKAERIVNKHEVLSDQNIERLRGISQELLAHRPVQYVLNEAWFHGMKFYVDEHVLIPRPETEELVEWAMKEVDRLQLKVHSLHAKEESRPIRVLDVGTGSGCIPVTLKKERPSLEVYACDISEGAVAVARKNAVTQSVDIEFMKLNFLNDADRSVLPLLDLVISNPPYIAEIEKSEIDKHVMEYEPHQALFVPTEDSLIFYKHLAIFGKTHLQGAGSMMMEIHYSKGEAVRNLFHQSGYKVELRKDMHGNERMVRAWVE